MGSIDYKKLYSLQDRVLKSVFDIEDEFYLTGGTALSRFYYSKRYSDDLDFFTNDSKRYFYAVKNVITKLQQDFKLEYEINSRDFVRVKVDALLQVDFVNDRVARYKEPNILDNGYKIDNIENILSNKFTAVIGRDDPKDIFDIYLIDKFNTVNYQEILEIAQNKMFFSKDDLLVRLKSFPKILLKNINLIDKEFLMDFDTNYENIIKKIENI
jgi:predicted nucleotidyltransferase component of viral defense system